MQDNVDSQNRYPGRVKEGDVNNNVTVALRELYNTLSNTNQAVPPLSFLQVLRVAFPQFAQKGTNGVPLQQDAEECWTQLLLTLSAKLPKIGENTEENKQLTLTNSAIGQLFAGETTAV
jgi:ubiquitin carboxyl-terminal hydrolase 14